MKAMVVDDSRAIRMILNRTLSDLGFEVVQAASGNEALSMLPTQGEQLSLILVDWNMPGISGLDFVRQVRCNPALASVALVMVTTETEIEQMMTALEAGANEYVMKPFTREIIADKLHLLGLVEQVAR
ncbi:MAG: response regulator [Bryobacteraceae bacterium]|nr:response regulator [Bryobacteraceae bacterium]